MKINKRFVILGILVIVAILVWIAVFAVSNNLEVIFFDIGQGDAALIQYKTQQILIDTGPSDKILEKLGKYMPFWDRDIELVILTHPDADHLKGLLYVLNRYDVKEILETNETKDTKIYKKYLELSKDVYKTKAKIGQRIKIGDAVLEVIYDDMIVSKLGTNQDDFLFMADAGFSIENKLNNINIIDILKVGHHGSKNSTSKDFLQKVMPRDIIISSGENNRYNHPHRELLDRIKDYNILLTINGDIRYETP